MKIPTFITDLSIGASGIGFVEIIEQSIPTDTTDIAKISNIVIQIIIGIATLFGLFKRKRVKKI
jgi:hypothetical protein